VVPEARLVEDLAVDSLDVLELTIAAERRGGPPGALLRRLRETGAVTIQGAPAAPGAAMIPDAVASPRASVSRVVMIDARAVTPWDWRPPAPWTGPRYGTVSVTREPAPLCSRCLFREGREVS
jgi:hypothetical protein